MKWKRHAYHAESECGRWIVNWTGGKDPVFMLVDRKGNRIVKVGTKQECWAATAETACGSGGGSGHMGR